MKKLPLARHHEVVVQKLDKEILVYDLLTHKAYHLNETASRVYSACDGQTAFSELRAATKFTDEVIFLALDELKKDNLLEANESYASPLTGMTRREVVRRVGLASMIALPVISSLIAPRSAAAASLKVSGRCASPAECQSGNCVSTSFLPVGSFCCPAGNGGTQLGPIGTAIGLACFNSCSLAAPLCCSGNAAPTTCDTGFCASQQQFCCACV